MWAILSWCLARVGNYYLKIFCLTGLNSPSSFLVFSLQEDFLEDLFLSMHIGISRLLAPQVNILAHMKQK